MAPHALKTADLLEVAVRVPVENEQPVADLLEQVFHQSPSLYTDEETLITRASIFLTSPAGLSPARRRRLEHGLERLHRDGLVSRRCRITSRRLPARNWSEAWKRHFQPLDIGGVLLVKPGFSRRAPRPGQSVVVIDPGLSFGTGQHPTTAFCLEQVVACRPRHRPRSLLDIGTGSGILAIAAAKLGYQPVEAFDFDPEAVRVARENIRFNEPPVPVRLRTADVRRLRPAPPARRFDVVCANLLADLLMTTAPHIAGTVAPGGTLVLAGILAAEFERVARVYAGLGWRCLASRTVREWRSGAFRQP